MSNETNVSATDLHGVVDAIEREAVRWDGLLRAKGAIAHLATLLAGEEDVRARIEALKVEETRRAAELEAATADAGKIVDRAKAEAGRIVEEAHSQAAGIVGRARDEAGAQRSKVLAAIEEKQDELAALTARAERAQAALQG